METSARPTASRTECFGLLLLVLCWIVGCSVEWCQMDARSCCTTPGPDGGALVSLCLTMCFYFFSAHISSSGVEGWSLWDWSGSRNSWGAVRLVWRWSVVNKYCSSLLSFYHSWDYGGSTQDRARCTFERCPNRPVWRLCPVFVHYQVASCRWPRSIFRDGSTVFNQNLETCCLPVRRAVRWHGWLAGKEVASLRDLAANVPFARAMQFVVGGMHWAHTHYTPEN